jgi:hypothetical protein
MTNQSPDSRGPACDAALEQSEAALERVRPVLGKPRYIDLAALAAALPPETVVFVDDAVRVDGPGEPGSGWVSAVVADMASTAAPPADRSDHAAPWTLLPALQLGTRVVPGPDTPLAPAPLPAWSAWTRLTEMLGTEPSESLPAAADVLNRLAALLIEGEDAPARWTVNHSTIPEQLMVIAVKLRLIGEDLTRLGMQDTAERVAIDAEIDVLYGEDEEGGDR